MGWDAKQYNSSYIGQTLTIALSESPFLTATYTFFRLLQMLLQHQRTYPQSLVMYKSLAFIIFASATEKDVYSGLCEALLSHSLLSKRVSQD